MHGLIVRGCATQRVALKRGAEAPGPRNGRASAATASWPALDSSLEQRGETVRTVLIRDSRFSRSAGFRAMRGSMTALHVGTDGGRLWRGAHECPPAVIAGGRECAPSNELPTEIDIGKCAEGIRGAYGARSGQRLCGSAAHGLIVRGCATQHVARKRGAARRRARGTAVRRLRPRVGPPFTLRSSHGARQCEPYDS